MEVRLGFILSTPDLALAVPDTKCREPQEPRQEPETCNTRRQNQISGKPDCLV
jgi:hypothetical protein